MQIRTRLTLQFIFVVALILALSFSAIYYSSANYRRSEFYERLENRALTMTNLLINVDRVDSSLLKQIERVQKDHLYLENIRIFDSNNKEMYSSNDTIDFGFSREDLGLVRLRKRFESTKGDFEILGLVFAARNKEFVVLSGAIDKFGWRKTINLRKNLVSYFFLILFVAALAGYIYAGRALQPISSVIDEVDNISPGNLQRRIPERKYLDEIGRLIATFNKLLDRIDQSFKAQKVFLAGASHELKNPLTVITSQLQVCLINDRDIEVYKRTISSVLEDITDLNKLTVQIMELARLSSNLADVRFEEVRMDELIFSIKKHFDDRLKDYRFDLHLGQFPEDDRKLLVMGNESLLKTAFLNLAENACKFSPDHKVIVDVKFRSKDIQISFSDNGPGIGADELKLIFEPFYRSQSTAEMKGHGIGLALVLQILDIHHSKLEIKPREHRGTTFQVELPISKS